MKFYLFFIYFNISLILTQNTFIKYKKIFKKATRFENDAYKVWKNEDFDLKEMKKQHNEMLELAQNEIN